MTVSKQIIEVFDNLADKFGQVIDWTGQNVMPAIEQICERYIKYEIGTSIVWAVIGLICIIAGIICLRTCKKSAIAQEEEEGYLEEGPWIGWLIGGIVGIVVGIPMIVTQVLEIIRCITFPEYQIYEFVKYITR